MSPRALLIACLPLSLSLSCRAAPPMQIERRVPVDVIGDCVALRSRISECPDDFAQVILERRTRKNVELTERLRNDGERQAALTDTRAELAREAELSPEERRQQCRVATAETPLPSPEDVARLHRCLPLSCKQRVLCLRPMMLPQ